MNQEGYEIRSKLFQFKVLWVMEESFEQEVKTLLEEGVCDIFSKFEHVRKGLGR